MNISRENEGFIQKKLIFAAELTQKPFVVRYLYIEAAFKNPHFIKGFVISKKNTDTFTLKPEFLENCFVFC